MPKIKKTLLHFSFPPGGYERERETEDRGRGKELTQHLSVFKLRLCSQRV